MLVAVAARDQREGRGDACVELGVDVPVTSIDELEPLADLVIECAPAHLLPQIAEPFLRAGKEVVVLSAGALLDYPHLLDLAATSGGTISVPTGALLGLDAVGAAAEGEIRSLRLTTRKPPAGLVGAPGIEASGIDLDDPDRAGAGLRRHRTRGRAGLPREPERRGRPVARRRRARSHRGRGLGRPGRDAGTRTRS